MTEVIFYYGVGSRYAYLASTQLERIERGTGCRFDWRPINSFKLRAMRKQEPFEGAPISGQYEWSYREQDARRWADHYRVPFVEPRGRLRFDSDELALAATAGRLLGRGREYSQALFHAVFRDPIECIDEAELVARAERVGLEAAIFRNALASQTTAEALASATEQAFDAGAFGVPSFAVDGAIFWGNDRLVLLEDHLGDRTGRDG